MKRVVMDIGWAVIALAALFLSLVAVGIISGDTGVLQKVAAWADAAFIALLVLLKPGGGGNTPPPDALKRDD